MTYLNTALPKLCHARVGQKVRLPGTATGKVLPEVFIVVALENPRHRPGRAGMPHGLYDEGRELRLVSLETGIFHKMPHLSSRAELLRDSDAPAVVVSALDEAWHQVSLSSKPGTVVHRDVNLADAGDVRDFLTHLATTGCRVVSLDCRAQLEAKLKADWRRAVAAEQTELSFEDFKQQAASA